MHRGVSSSAAPSTAASVADGEDAPVRVVLPPLPTVPIMHPIPSTVTTPTIAPVTANASHNHSFAGRVAAMVGSSLGRFTPNASFGSAPPLGSDLELDGGLDTTAHNNHNRNDMDGNGDTNRVAPAAAADGEREVNHRPAMVGYFGYMFGGALNAYIGLILSDGKGFTKSSVGFLVSFSPIFQITILPLLSFVADRFNCATAMLCTCAVSATIASFLFISVTSTTAVVLFFLLFVACQTPMNPLLDKHTLAMFPPKGRTAAWGYVRSYGAYGWGVGCVVAGLLVYWGNYWGVMSFQFALGQVALIYCMAVTQPYEAVDHAESSSVRFSDVLAILVQHPRLLLFLFASCMMGMGYSFINNFLFIFLAELGGSEALMGLTVLITVSTEIPIFQRADSLHDWLTERQMMTLSMLIWTVRVIGYSFLQWPWLVLLLEPLHGVTFAFMWLPGVKLISEIFPPKLASSATGTLFTFVSGFGAIIGNVFAGILFDAVGARWMFRIAATAMLTAFVAYQLLDRYLESRGHMLGKNHSDEGNDDAANNESSDGAAHRTNDGADNRGNGIDDRSSRRDDNKSNHKHDPLRGRAFGGVEKPQDDAQHAATCTAVVVDDGHHHNRGADGQEGGAPSPSPPPKAVLQSAEETRRPMQDEEDELPQV